MPPATYKTRYVNSWALVVGINAYPQQPLGYAVNDANAFGSLLIDRFGFPKKNVTLLLDKDGTRDRIRSALYGIAKVAGDDDRVVVFYAGHGVTLPAHGREMGFLVPIDARDDDTSTLVPWDDLSATSRLIRAKHMLFVMDACYGGLIGMRRASAGTQRQLADMLTRGVRQFLTAGKADELVADSGGPRKGHSVFTGHLLDVLEESDKAPDGVVSANAVMARVYDRVSKDEHSFQSPHYGFLSGDGDLFFKAPEVRENPVNPEEGIMVTVPADVLEPNEGTAMEPLLDTAKELISDNKYHIKLFDLVNRELRATQQKTGEKDFPTNGITFSAGDFADRLLRYEAASGDILRLSVLLGRWSRQDQAFAIRRLVDVLAGQLEYAYPETMYQWLRLFPMLLTMYCGGIAAIEGERYENLNVLLSTEVPTPHRQTNQTIVEATTSAMQGVTVEAFRTLPGHEKNFSPLSEYLFRRIQPIVEDILFLGNRYEKLFDRFEVFYALVFADRTNRNWGHLGRYAWKYRGDSESNPFVQLRQEAAKAGENWPPLRAGFFNGSAARFLEVSERVIVNTLSRL